MILAISLTHSEFFAGTTKKSVQNFLTIYTIHALVGITSAGCAGCATCFLVWFLMYQKRCAVPVDVMPEGASWRPYVVRVQHLVLQPHVRHALYSWV